MCPPTDESWSRCGVGVESGDGANGRFSFLPQVNIANPITGTFIKWILINDSTICQANAI